MARQHAGQHRLRSILLAWLYRCALSETFAAKLRGVLLKVGGVGGKAR